MQKMQDRRKLQNLKNTLQNLEIIDKKFTSKPFLESTFSFAENTYGLLEKFKHLQYPKEFNDKYNIIEEIGNGMQASVYKIKDIKNGEIWTAKVFRPVDEELIFLIMKEAEILGSLNHKNIIKLKEFIRDSSMNCYILILENFKSVTLGDYNLENLLENQKMSEVLSQIYDSLDYIHNNGIIHRDFNVNNILIDEITSNIKIIDFGLSKYHEKTDFLMSPIQGNFKYRMPQSIYHESKNPFFEDVWGFVVIAVSLLIHKNISSNRVVKLFEELVTKPSKSEYDTNEPLIIFSKAFLIVVKEETYKETENKKFDIFISLSSPLKQFKNLLGG